MPVPPAKMPDSVPVDVLLRRCADELRDLARMQRDLEAAIIEVLSGIAVEKPIVSSIQRQDEILQRIEELRGVLLHGSEALDGTEASISGKVLDLLPLQSMAARLAGHTDQHLHHEMGITSNGEVDFF